MYLQARVETNSVEHYETLWLLIQIPMHEARDYVVHHLVASIDSVPTVDLNSEYLLIFVSFVKIIRTRVQ